MGGFLAGSFTLIVLQVLLQPGTAGKVEQGTNLFVAGIRRALASDVAGIPERTARRPAEERPYGGGHRTIAYTDAMNIPPAAPRAAQPPVST